MALIGNYSLLNRAAYKQFATGVSSGYVACTVPPSSLKNRLYGGFDSKSATFTGYLHPMSYVLPMKSGAMGSFVQSNGVAINVVAQLYAGLNIEGTSLVSISVTNAQLDQIVALVASGLMSIVSANGGLSAAVGMDAVTNLVISVNSAQLGGIFDVSASGSMSISPVAMLTALAHIEAEAGGPTPLSPEGLALAVWAANSSANNAAGSMGELLNGAGGGSSPSAVAAAVWDELLSNHNVSGTYGERVQKLLTLSQFLGLK